MLSLFVSYSDAGELETREEIKLDFSHPMGSSIGL